MRRARRWTWCVLLAALPLLAGGMALAGDDTMELFVLLDPARADIDGNGLVSPGEAMTFKELLGILTPEDPVLALTVDTRMGPAIASQTTFAFEASLGVAYKL